MVRGLVIAGFALAFVACAKERRVEAPVVDVAAAPDASPPRELAFPSAPSADDRAESGTLVGRWEGIATQNDGQTWAMRVEIVSITPGACAVADYPTIPCRGAWTCVGARSGTLIAREHLLDDSATRCVDNGNMTMRLAPDGSLEWAWSGQGETAEATLRRAR